MIANNITDKIEKVLDKFNYYNGTPGVGNHIPSKDFGYRHIAEAITALIRKDYKDEKGQ